MSTSTLETNVNQYPLLHFGQTPYRCKFPHLVTIKGGSDLTTKLYTTHAHSKDSIIATLTDLIVFEKKDYTTVQVSKDCHISLDSEFVFTNHACDPTVHFKIVDGKEGVKKIEVRAAKDLEAGDELTFFYPSTELEMDQPFACWCKSEKCFKSIRGAKFLSKDQLKDMFINEYILEDMNN